MVWRPFALKNLGFVAYSRGDQAGADGLLNQALAALRSTGNSFGVAITLINMAKISRDRGDLVRAAELYSESLTIRWQQNDRVVAASCLRGLALVASDVGNHVRAVRLLATNGALRAAMGVGESRSTTHKGALDRARQALGDATFEQTWAAG